MNKVGQIVRDDGFVGLLRRSSRFFYKSVLRPLLPGTNFYRKNGVKWKDKKSLDPYFGINYDDPTYEAALVSAVRSNVRPGDYVGVIGGGRGISTVVAAESAGEEGGVIVYEGAEERTDWIRNTVTLNAVESIVEVEHAIVGPRVKVYGVADSAKQVNSSDLPAFDVLEMDCEGAELDILKNLTIRPGVIVVEVHPENCREEDVTWVLSNMGYEIVDRGLENPDTDQPLPILTARLTEE